MNQLQAYINTLAKTISIDDESNEYTIPISLVSEENIVHKFMENIKANIRSSIEYKRWVKSFKERFGPAICSVSDNSVTIEVHHHPFTLEDYVEIALASIYNNNLTYTTFLVADLVMRWHYMDYVCGCFMSKTYHMRFHDEHDITIPEDCIHGDLEGFLNDALIKPYISEHLIDKLSIYMPNLYNKLNLNKIKKNEGVPHF